MDDPTKTGLAAEPKAPEAELQALRDNEPQGEGDGLAKEPGTPGKEREALDDKQQ